MKVWRIDKKRRSNSARTGEGARITGGRWNSPGVAVIYASQFLSLAVLEVLVHAPDPSARTIERIRASIDVPDPLIETLPRSALPANFGPKTALSVTQGIGDDWLSSQRTAALLVPSAIVPLEHNLLLNPNHPDYPSFAWSSFESVHLDPRLWTV